MHATKRAAALALLVAALLLALAPGAQASRTLKNAPQPPVTLNVCSKDRPMYEFSEIADPSATCELGKANNLKQNVLNLKNWDEALSKEGSLYCNGCWLYHEHVQSQRSDDTVTSSFVITAETKGQQLMLPLKPCRGVEDVLGSSNCGGEGIWRSAAQRLAHDGKTLTHAMGFNPTHRRSQHQMHMHIAEARPGVNKMLAGVDPKNGWTALDCSNSVLSLSQCTVGKPVGAGGQSKVLAKAFDAADLSKIQPFDEVYGAANPSGEAHPEAFTSVAVFQPAANRVVIVLSNRQTECGLKCDECLNLCPDH